MDRTTFFRAVGQQLPIIKEGGWEEASRESRVVQGWAFRGASVTSVTPNAVLRDLERRRLDADRMNATALCTPVMVARNRPGRLAKIPVRFDLTTLRLFEESGREDEL